MQSTPDENCAHPFAPAKPYQRRVYQTEFAYDNYIAKIFSAETGLA